MDGATLGNHGVGAFEELAEEGFVHFVSLAEPARVGGGHGGLGQRREDLSQELLATAVEEVARGVASHYRIPRLPVEAAGDLRADWYQSWILAAVLDRLVRAVLHDRSDIDGV